MLKEQATVSPRCLGLTQANTWQKYTRSGAASALRFWLNLSEWLKAKGEGGGRGRDRLDSITDTMDMNWSKSRETVEDGGGCSPWGRKELDTT